MKKTSFFAGAGIFLMFICLPAAGITVHQFIEHTPHYVVIGAFAVENNAMRFTNQANSMHLHAKFEFNANRNLYYVYVLQTDNVKEAIDEAARLRSETKFSDTWVYNGAFGNPGVASNVSADINPVSQTKLEQVNVQDQPESSPVDSTLTASVQIQSVEQPATPATEEDVASKGKNFFFKLYQATNNEIVQGEVDIVDAEKSKKIGSYPSNARVKVPSPKTKSSDIILQCNVFGYRKLQRTINYDNPVGEDLRSDANNVIVPFELVRLQKGDIAVMYNVFFYKDAAIMRPESKYEIDNLLAMLNDNPKYKIKIHGHTNGRSQGRILSMGSDNNFFSLTGSKEGFGSAKLLSEERAKVIRAYLVSNGIDVNRMLIKAWGGKRPMYDKHHARAAENVRVEIEILDN